MANAALISGIDGNDGGSSDEPGRNLHFHSGDDDNHNKHHHHHHNDPLDRVDDLPYIPQDSYATRRWRQNMYEADDDDAEQQPLLTSRSRRVSPGPIVAILALIVLIAILAIVIVTIRSDGGYTGAGGAFY